MGTTYRIAEVAERSGFTPATLRYYEEIGLLAPRGRTDAGYRLYDDGSLDRLKFIARAKQLGCSLDEIADLAGAWDGGRCSHVQERLRATAQVKVAEAHARIAGLTRLAADLQRAVASLAVRTSDGPCDETCGCVADLPADVAAAAAPVGVPLVTKAAAVAAAGGESPPVACTLAPDAIGDRIDDWVSIQAGTDGLADGVTGRTAIDGGVRLEFGPGTDVAGLAALAAAEQACCEFFSFTLVIDGRGVALEVRAPAEAADVVTAAFGAPAA